MTMPLVVQKILGSRRDLFTPPAIATTILMRSHGLLDSPQLVQLLSIIVGGWFASHSAEKLGNGGLVSTVVSVLAKIAEKATPPALPALRPTDRPDVS